MQPILIRSDPEVSSTIFEYGSYFIPRKTVCIIRVVQIACESTLTSIKFIKTPFRIVCPWHSCPNPKDTFPVFINGPNLVVTQACWIIGIVPEMIKLSCFNIQAIQTFIRSYPKIPKVVHMNGVNSITTYTFGIIRVMSVMCKSLQLRVKPV